MKLVAPLRSFGRADLALAGGKGANLGELMAGGFPVPDGFVVTTDAYALVAAGLSTREAVERAEVPAELRRAVAGAYAELGGGPVAVRSSATAEDLPGAAFAGQQDTYLNVVGEEALVDAVRRCWGSLWTDRAVAYRDKLGIDHGEVRIAVVVQRMVEAEAAGVMFSADPVTGERGHLVVDASTGLGEAVVSGLVTPDHYVLTPGGEVKDFRPGRREVIVRGTAGGGVVHESGDGTPGERLPDAALRELAGLGTRVAAHFGRPQDMEWTYAGGRISLVQARPMTALPPPPVGRLNPLQRKLLTVLLEYVPVRPYPIDMTTWAPHGPAGLMAKMTAYFGLRGAFEGFLEERDGVVYRLNPPRPHPTLRVLGTPYRFLAKARRYDPARWTEDPRFHAFLRTNRELTELDLAALPWQELVRVPRRTLDAVQPMADLRIDYLPGAGRALLRLLSALKLRRRGKLFGALITGARTRTSDANDALEELAAEGPDGARFEEMFRAFLAEYGHRETATPLLVTPPTWADAPDTVLGLVKVLAAGPPRKASGDDALDRLLASLKSPRTKARLDRLVRAARAGVAFREDSHFYFTKPLPVLRRSLLELGRRLFDDPQDVFHLRLEELEAITDPDTADLRALRSAVTARAAKREELAGVRLIDPRAIYPAPATGDALVAGAPASAGTATGPVKVIRDPSEFGKLDGGDVLVCPYTNPSWTPLFQRAAAVVVDAGGSASHAAIVAREYGIPAVMGTGDGTAVLADGRLVTVDGDAGLVTAAPQHG
ncbi:PEP/pyruvate-binding domain-containing protein [Nonomuraea sp. SBT364]|uniref:PEP/pyruvate-binding domain-containing protein n=1 Tax=Nonomuraea sp. SBT364 TaxID=1580530 RepID=UPI00066E3034|nr:PEP/pyruvate-binding domain-containing protein [Nonomuraea sp. SBT364]